MFIKDKMLILLDYLNFQVVEGDFFYKAILAETCFGSALKLPDGSVQPDRIFQIKFIAKLFQAMKNFMCACIFPVIADNRIFEKVVVLPDFSP